MKQQGTLWLIPTPLGDEKTPWLLEQDRLTIIAIQHFVVEAEKTARKHLKALGITTPLRELSLSTLNEHSKEENLSDLIKPLLAGQDVGLISEAGCPAVADPGANLVALAHRHNIVVRPLIGPSSILLALMASGANGQHFSFHGYLPTDKQQRITALKNLEKRSFENNETQIFIETPYRNTQLIEDALTTLKPHTRFCVAANLTLPNEAIISCPVNQWPKVLPERHKQPCVFVLHHQ